MKLKKKGITLFALSLGTGFVNAQAADLNEHLRSENSKINLDAQSIRAQGGCYEVKYQFIETFAVNPRYPVRSPEYQEKGLEWIEVTEDSPKHITLQHILKIPHGALKHWSQEWTYQPNYTMFFQGDNHWVKKELDPASQEGMWAQQVYQVDGSPRYGCVAPWVHWNQHTYWECETWSPLPRREFTRRDDYNVLQRRNRHEIHSWGWMHEQNNLKLKVKDGVQTAIAFESGKDTYTKVDDSRCNFARQWWKSNHIIWDEIDSVWKEIYDSHNEIHLKGKVDSKVLWEKLFELAETIQSHDLQSPENKAKFRKTVLDTISEYLN